MAKQAKQLQEKLKAAATLENLPAADAIQKMARRAPQLTALCGFDWPQRMRRLLSIPAQVWKPMDERWAAEALKQIEGLRANIDAPAALALACFGIHTLELPAALAELSAAGQNEAAPQAAEPTWPAAPVTGAQPQPQRQMSKRPKKPVENEEPDDELDPETLASLEALRSEIAALGG